jgi:hypothetical protein
LRCCQPNPNSPQLSVCTLDRPLFQAIHSPLGGLFQIGRPGQSRPDPVHQLGGIPHDLRTGLAFIADSAVHHKVGRVVMLCGRPRIQAAVHSTAIVTDARMRDLRQGMGCRLLCLRATAGRTMT